MTAIVVMDIEPQTGPRREKPSRTMMDWFTILWVIVAFAVFCAILALPFIAIFSH